MGGDRMRAYWDERARRNATWYVDTDTDYSAPDMQKFFATGRAVVAEALDGHGPTGSALAVEIGSGLGRICLALAERFERVIGLDVSPEMVRRARQLVSDPRVTFEVNDGTSLGAVADDSVDVVLSFTVFQHIPDVTVIEQYLAESARVLRPGGLLVFQWNNIPGARRWRVKRAMLGALQRTGVWREPHERHAPEFLGSRVPLSRVRRALERAGLDLTDAKGEGMLFAWAWARRP